VAGNGAFFSGIKRNTWRCCRQAGDKVKGPGNRRHGVNGAGALGFPFNGIKG
jgi:hypothetical protein